MWICGYVDIEIHGNTFMDLGSFQEEEDVGERASLFDSKDL
jgi:hypothetical protein